MNAQQIELIVQLFQTIVWPAIAAGLLWLYHKLKKNLPANKQTVLDGIIQDAVQMVEQTLAKASPEEKRKAAQEAIYDAAAFLGINNLDPSIVNTILESFVWETKQVKLDPVVTLDTTSPKQA